MSYFTPTSSTLPFPRVTTQRDENPFRTSTSSTPTSAGWLSRWTSSMRQSWKRHQYLQIQKAIRTYSFEKDCLSSTFRPVAAASTVRSALNQIERNKLPFHAETGRPWLASADGPVRFHKHQPLLHTTTDEPSQALKKEYVENDCPIILIT